MDWWLDDFFDSIYMADGTRWEDDFTGRDKHVVRISNFHYKSNEEKMFQILKQSKIHIFSFHEAWAGMIYSQLDKFYSGTVFTQAFKSILSLSV